MSVNKTPNPHKNNQGEFSFVKHSSPASAVPESDSALARAVSKVKGHVLPLFVVMFILNYIDRVNIGFAKLTMLQDLQFSEAVYGLGAGIFFIGYFLFEVPSNLLLEKIGARKTLARITILWGLASMAMAYVTTPTSFYILRFLLGIFEAGFFPGVVLYLTYWFPAKRRARVNGLFMTSFAIAGAVGGPIAGLIMGGMEGVGHLANWQWLFIIEGIPSILAGLAVLARLRPGYWWNSVFPVKRRLHRFAMFALAPSRLARSWPTSWPASQRSKVLQTPRLLPFVTAPLAH